MISIENLYWILYENLLKPVNLGVLYYYPFGTKDRLIHGIYDDLSLDLCLYRQNPKVNAMAFFYHDQEPIYSGDDSAIPMHIAGSIFKYPRLLANSERSIGKKNLCKKHNLLDWYFFYHGLAVLDWYRDAKYIKRNDLITNKFCSLNHLIDGKRAYRMSMLARLAEKGILDQGQVSFHGDFNDCIRELENPDSLLDHEEKTLINRWLVEEKIQRMIVDKEQAHGGLSACFGDQEYRMRQKSFITIVNETVFYDRIYHLTEKIFQPIICLRPFMLVSSPGNLSYLKSYGFQTFDKWIDESYDQEQNDSVRMQMITDELVRICSKSIGELQEMLDSMNSVLQYNKQHLFGPFCKIIVDEMVDNFDQCLKSWNNGRIDRVWPYHPDLDSVKAMLCHP